MTCARREAGARPPAPSTSAGAPRRADARTGRARARLFGLLPALALLLGALGLFAPAPAMAQTTSVWSATLTVGAVPDNVLGSRVGCNYQEPCASRLTDDDFEVGGAAYAVRGVWAFTGGTMDGALEVRFSENPNAALEALNFCVGSTAYPLAGATSRFYRWPAGPDWTAGDRVALSIAATCGATTPVTPPVTTPEVGFELGSYSAAEHLGEIAAALTLSSALSQASTVTVSVKAGATATSGTDFMAPTSIALPAGTTYVVFTVPVTDDSEVEQDETFTLVLSAVQSAPYTVSASAGEATFEIDDDDWSPPTGLTVSAGTGKLDLSWTASPDFGIGLGSSYTVQHRKSSVTNDAVTGDADTGWVENTGVTATSYSITGLDAGAAYDVRVRLARGTTTSAWAAGSGTLGSGPPTAVTLRVDNSNPAEGETVTVTAELDQPAPRTYTVPIVFTLPVGGVSSTASNDDITVGAAMAIQAGERTATTTIAIVDDADEEPEETIAISLNAATIGLLNLLTPSVTNYGAGVVVTIQASDQPAPPPPSGAVWSATLTVGAVPDNVLGNRVGCNYERPCASRLTDDDFEIGGAAYTVRGVWAFTGGTMDGALEVRFSENPNAALEALNFCVGGTAYPLAGATSRFYRWSDVADPGWSAGDRVALSIAATCSGTTPVTPVTPSVPQSVTVTPVAHSDGTPALRVTFTNPETSAYPYSLVQVRPASATGAWPAQSGGHSLPAGAEADTQGTNHSPVFIVSGLSPGVEYAVRLHFVDNNLDPVAASSAPVRATTWNVPGAPTSVDPTAGDASLAVSWAAPTSTGGTGASITGYKVRWRVKDADPNTQGNQPGNWNNNAGVDADDSTARTHAIASLTNGAVYEVEVRALNGINPGSAWSAAGEGTPAATPPASAAVWSATLTVKDLGSNNLGCSNGTSGGECSSTSVLTKSDFTLSGNSYAVTSLVATNTGSFQVSFNRLVVTDTALQALKICVGTTAFAMTSGNLGGGQSFSFGNANLAWSAGDTISLSIASSCGGTTPPAQSTDATLSALTATSSASASGTFGALTLTPVFAAATTGYSASVANSITHVKLTPTVNHASATVEVGKQGQTLTTVSSATASAAIALSEGANPITVKVTAQDGTSTETYTVTVIRAAAPLTSGMLVSNAGQSEGGSAPLGDGPLWQKFTTGSDGATLEHIKWVFNTAATTPGNVVAELWSSGSDGRPGSRLASLTVPSSLPAGTNTFTAPANTRLKPGTAYWAMIGESGGSAGGRVSHTESNDLDSGSRTGWSIGPGYLWGSKDNPGVNSSDEFRISVDGVPILSPTSVTLSVDNANPAEGDTITITAELDQPALEDYRVFLGVNAAVNGVTSTDTSGAGTRRPSELSIAAGERTATGRIEILDDDDEEGEEVVAISPWVATGTGADLAAVASITTLNGVVFRIQASDQPAPPPANAVWSSTLTVEASSSDNVFGCSDFWSVIDSCSSQLTDDEFTFEDGTYQVTEVVVSSSALSLGFDGEISAGNPLRTRGRFHVDGVTFDLSAGTWTTNNEEVSWTEGRPTWTDSQKVSLHLSVPPTGVQPPSAAALVSNFGQTKNRTTTGTNGLVLAHGFTTGTHTAGYTLTSIETVLEANPNAAQRGTIRAELWSEATGGGPGSKSADLTVPASVSAGTVTFAAPADTTLSASTTYFFVLYTTGNFQLSVANTLSKSEDAGAAAGWSIADGFHYFLSNTPPSGTATWTLESNIVDYIRVNGAAASGSGQQQGPDGRLGPALTAAFEDVPAEHDGEAAFALLVGFSDVLGDGGTPPTEASFAVTGGKVKRVKQVGAGLWRVRVKPDSWRDVELTLAGGRACGEDGAVCTADGRALFNTASATVGGPVRIRLKGGRGREGRDESLDFTVSLSRAALDGVSVDYETADGTATAGEDYTAVSGTLVFPPGETERTVPVTILDDAIDEGRETFFLRLSNPQGAYLRNTHREAKGVIVNDDPLQKMWLSRFGRTVGSQIVDGVSERLGGLAPGAHATLAGQALDLSRADDGAALAEALTGLARVFGAPGAPAANDDDPFARLGLGGGPDEPAAVYAPARSVTGRELLLGSSFHLVTEGEGSGPGLAAWGRAVQGSFDGEEEAGGERTRVDGTVLTGTLGADADFGRLLAGVAVSLSEGEGSFSSTAGNDKGDIESTMTTVSPYARFRLTDRVSAWGLAGWGTGDMTVTQDARANRAEKVTKTDLTMQLGAVGARGALLRPDGAEGFDLALKGDAFFVRTESEKAANSAATTADASRVRLVLEGGRRFALGEGASFRPSLELGVRHDGGDAETGTGVEVGGGVSYADAASGLSIEAKARMLVAHADDDYEEWGASASVRLDPGERGRGLSFSLAPTIGATSSAAERLWGAHDARALAPGGDFEAARGLQGQMGYGMALFGDRFTGTPNLAFGMADGGARDYRIGWRLTSVVRGDPGFEVNLDAVRREAANDDAEHGVMLRSLIRW